MTERQLTKAELNFLNSLDISEKIKDYIKRIWRKKEQQTSFLSAPLSKVILPLIVIVFYINTFYPLPILEGIENIYLVLIWLMAIVYIILIPIVILGQHFSRKDAKQWSDLLTYENLKIWKNKSKFSRYLNSILIGLLILILAYKGYIALTVAYSLVLLLTISFVKSTKSTIQYVINGLESKLSENGPQETEYKIIEN